MHRSPGYWRVLPTCGLLWCLGSAGAPAAAAAPAGTAARPAAHTAPAPAGSERDAAAVRHPDFSGVWTWYIPPGKKPALGRPGAGLKLPFTAVGRKKVDAYRALVAPTHDNPGAHCLGYGMPEAMLFSGGYPMEIVQRPKLIVVIYEAYTEVRQLYLGDKIIPAGSRIPSRDGYSTARWQGDTLVVETTALKDAVAQTYPHSAQARIVERYHLARGPKGAKLLIDDWTLTDPVFYTRPVSGEKKWAFAPKGILLPYDCNEEGWLDHLAALKKAAAHKGSATHAGSRPAADGS